MEKFCPNCGRVYGEDATACEDDGERLVILNEEPNLVGRVIEGNYTLKAELGEGGMGTVYLADQASMGREVAVKVLRRELTTNKLATTRFLREARAASKLSHPNTITVYDSGQTSDGLLYIVMEKLQGRPLDEILEEEGPLGAHRAVHILAQVCDSLAEAHANGILHRDLKPENIFIEPKMGNPEHVKVLDFGIAKMADDGNMQATATGMICGTPSYMSPEQAMGKKIDPRSDIYALGIILYECLTGERPFDGESPMEVMLKHLNEPPPALPPSVDAVTPPALTDLMARMLSKFPDERPGSCLDLKEDLLEAIGTAATVHQAPAVSRGRRTPRSGEVTNLEQASADAALKPRRGGLWLALAVVVLLAGGIAVYLATRPAPTAPARMAQADAEDTAAPLGAAPGAGHDEGSQGAGAQASAVHPDGGTAAGDATDRAEGKAADAGGPSGDADAGAGPSAAVPAVEHVSLRVESEPAGAEVYEGDVLLGSTPLTLDRVKGSPPVSLTLKRSGFKPLTLRLGTASSLSVTRKLVPSRRAGGGKRSPGKAKGHHTKPKPKHDGGGGGAIGTF